MSTPMFVSFEHLSSSQQKDKSGQNSAQTVNFFRDPEFVFFAKRCSDVQMIQKIGADLMHQIVYHPFFLDFFSIYFDFCIQHGRKSARAQRWIVVHCFLCILLCDSSGRCFIGLSWPFISYVLYPSFVN